MGFTLTDFLIIAALYSSPMILFIIFIVYLSNSMASRFCQIALTRLIIPQLFVMLTGIIFLLWLELDVLALRLGLIFSCCFSLLLCLAPLGNKYLRNTLRVIITSHILCLTLTVSMTHYMQDNRGFTEISEAWEKHMLLRVLARASHGNTRELALFEGIATREKLLKLAAADPATPVKVLQYLTDQVNSPYEVTLAAGEFSYSNGDTPFYIAFQANNINAVRIFSEQLIGSEYRAQHHREILIEDNPLVPKTYNFQYSQNERTALFALTNLIYPIIPELITDAVHQNIINSRDNEVIAFFWNKKPPEDRLLMLKELAAMNKKEQLVKELMLTPDYLLPDEPLWQSLVSYIFTTSSSETVEAILNTGMINWSLYIDNKSANNDIIIDFQHRRDFNNPAIHHNFGLLLQTLVKQNIELSDRQLLHITADDQGLETVLAAGFTCERMHRMMETELENPAGWYQTLKKRIQHACPPA